MRRYEIENKTHYRTSDLLALLRRAAQEVFDPGQKPLIRCEVVYSRTRVASGCAYLGGRGMTLRLRKDPPPSMREVAVLIVHEMGHLRGLDHAAMRGGARWTWRGLGAGGYERHLATGAWADGMQLRVREPKLKQRPSGLALIEAKRARVAAGVKRWEGKAKRATNALKKLKAQARYYEKKAAAYPNDERASDPIAEVPE